MLILTMESILDWGVGVIVWLQRFSPALDLPFRALTFLGDEGFFVLFLPFLYWSVDRRTGARLMLLFLVSGLASCVAKSLADQPRPFEYSDQVRQLGPASGGGLPSGHTQNAVVVWGYLAWQLRRRWAWVGAALLMLFIPLSRLYLGVHFPTDLLGGYVLGAVIFVLFVWLGPRVEGWLSRKGIVWQLVAAALPCVLLALPLPQRAGGGGEVAAGATLAGMGIGFALERRWVGFESAGTWRSRLLRFALGGAVLFGGWWAKQAVLGGAEPAAPLRFAWYLLLGLAGALAAPWAFVKLRLAESRASGEAKGSGLEAS